MGKVLKTVVKTIFSRIIVWNLARP